MLKTKIQLLLLPIIISVAGCVGHYAMASRLNSISPGMPKSEVIGFLGRPERTASGPDYEELTYTLNESAWDTKMPEPYVIRLVGGKVQRFGTKKEIELFYSAKDNASFPTRPDLYSELIKLDDLRKKGLLSDAEYEAQKAKLLEKH